MGYRAELSAAKPFHIDKVPVSTVKGFAVVTGDGDFLAAFPTRQEACRWADNNEPFSGVCEVTISSKAAQEK